MGTNLQNNLVVQLAGDITTASTSVAISADLERGQTVTATGCYAVLRNKNGSKIERVKGDAAAGTFTFTKRGLDQSDSDVEVSGLKKSWKTGQQMYITLLSSQIVDKQNSNTYGSGTTQTFDDIDVNGDATFDGSLKVPVYATTAARDAAITSPVNGMECYVTADGLFYDYKSGAWSSRASGANGNAGTTVAGIAEEATLSEQGSQTAIGSTGARLFINPVNTAKTSSGASDENKIPVLDATGKLASGFIPTIPTQNTNLELDLQLGEDVATNLPVVLLNDGSDNGRLYRYQENSTAQSTGMTGITFFGTNSSIALNGNTVVNAFSTTAGGNYFVRLQVSTISGDTYTNGSSVDTTYGNAGTGVFNLVRLSDTSFVLISSYVNTGTSQKFVDARAFTVSGTTITSGTNVTLHNPGTAARTGLQGLCIVANNKVAVSYQYNSINHLVAFTVSGTTITAGTPVASVALSGACVYVSDDRIAIANGTDNRIYTFSGTTPTAGNNLSLGATYTGFTYRDIGGGLSIYSGTTGGNTQAFVINNVPATPVKGATVTVVTGATNVNCMQADGNATVVILTSNGRGFFYNYSGTTLTYNYDRAITSFLTYLRPFVFHNAALNGSTLEQQIIRNYRQFAIGITKTGGVTNGIVKVAVNGAGVTGFSGLVPGITYWSNSSGNIGVSGDYIIGKAISTSAILVSIPYANL